MQQALRRLILCFVHLILPHDVVWCISIIHTAARTTTTTVTTTTITIIIVIIIIIIFAVVAAANGIDIWFCLFMWNSSLGSIIQDAKREFFTTQSCLQGTALSVPTRALVAQQLQKVFIWLWTRLSWVCQDVLLIKGRKMSDSVEEEKRNLCNSAHLMECVKKRFTHSPIRFLLVYWNENGVIKRWNVGRRKVKNVQFLNG